MGKFNSLIIKCGLSNEYVPSTQPDDQSKIDQTIPIDDELFDGTGAYQCNGKYKSQRTLATGGNETIDLTSLTDPHGAAIGFASVKAIYLYNRRTNSTNLTYKGHSSAGFLGFMGANTHTITIRPGGKMLLTDPNAGWAVANGSTDNINIANAAGASNTYDIEIVGVLL